MSGIVQRKPTGLMQRLAMLAGAEESGSSNQRITYRSGIGTYFGVGLLGGGLVGAAGLLSLPWIAPGQAGARAQVPEAIAALAHWSPESAAVRARKTAPPRVREPQPDAFEVVIDRSARADAPFALHLVGSQDATMLVLLHGVPEAATLSRGERRGPSTWAVRAADLEHLHLALNEGTPDTFDIRFDVMAPRGVTAASSIVRVRLVGQPRIETAAAAPVIAPAPLEAAPAVAEAPRVAIRASMESPPVHVPAASRNEPRKRERTGRAAPPVPVTTVEMDRHAAPVAPVAEARHWPEGASGLGATARESDRQVWWKLPAPTWRPFDLAVGR